MEKIFEKMGLEPNETKIYLFLLQNGNSTQQEISNETCIIRQTIYDLVKKMEVKGYIKSSSTGKRKNYSAINPDILLQRLEEKELEFKQILPDLKKMENSNNFNLVSENFIGISGLKNLFDMTLNSTSDVLWLANNKTNIEVFKDFYWKNYAVKRIENKVQLKLLIESDKKVEWHTSKKLHREIRKNNLMNDLTSSLVLFEDKIILYSYESNHLFGTFIQNESMNHMFKKFFYETWDKSDIVHKE